MNISYNRKSTSHQTFNRLQLDESKFDKVFYDTCSGGVPFRLRDGGKTIYKLVEQGKVTSIEVEELSRIGRNASDTLRTIDFLKENNVIIHIRNISLSSVVDGKPNSIFTMVVTILAGISQNEKETILERSRMGLEAYIAKGGKLGRPKNSGENDKSFMLKHNDIIQELKNGESIRRVNKLTGKSTSTIQKVKKILSC